MAKADEGRCVLRTLTITAASCVLLTQLLAVCCCCCGAYNYSGLPSAAALLPDRSWPVDPQLARQVAEQLQRVLELRDTPHAAAVEELGRNCHLPNSCQTPLHAVLHHMHKWQQQQQQQSGEGGDGGCGGSASQEKKEAKQQVLVAAVRDALAAGGCCASRASYVGACMGAVLGLDALPEEWLHTKYEASGRVCSWADAVCDSRR